LGTIDYVALGTIDYVVLGTIDTLDQQLQCAIHNHDDPQQVGAWSLNERLYLIIGQWSHIPDILYDMTVGVTAFGVHNTFLYIDI
jgi:hypothetical protein